MINCYKLFCCSSLLLSLLSLCFTHVLLLLLPLLELRLFLALIIHAHPPFLVFLVLCVLDAFDCWFMLSDDSLASSTLTSASFVLACPLRLPDSSCRFGFLCTVLYFGFPNFRLPPSLRVHQQSRDTLIQQRGPKYTEENCCILKTVTEAPFQ